jgi:hypothetical protein
MDYEKLFELAKPFLEKNDLGAAHTSRVLAIARENFPIPKEFQDVTVTAIILHDIGGGSIREQYEKGPKIAASILRQVGTGKDFIEQVCEIVATHHDHPDQPSLPFRILFDSDKLVMFTKEEFAYYDSTPNFDWSKILGLIYSEHAKSLAIEMLRQRRNEKSKRVV